MKKGGSKAGDDHVAVYAELRPIPRHRSLIDHLFVLRDYGRLAGAGGNLFGSPFSEIAGTGRCPNHDGEHNQGMPGWKVILMTGN